MCTIFSPTSFYDITGVTFVGLGFWLRKAIILHDVTLLCRKQHKHNNCSQMLQFHVQSYYHPTMARIRSAGLVPNAPNVWNANNRSITRGWALIKTSLSCASQLRIDKRLGRETTPQAAFVFAMTCRQTTPQAAFVFAMTYRGDRVTT